MFFSSMQSSPAFAYFDLLQPPLLLDPSSWQHGPLDPFFPLGGQLIIIGASGSRQKPYLNNRYK